MEIKTRRKALLWLSIAASLFASGYAFISSVYYAWMSALGTVTRASLWAYVTLGLSAVFFFLFVYLAVCLRRCYSDKPQ